MKTLLGIAAFALAAACPFTAAHRDAAASASAADEPTISLVHQELALGVDAELTVQFHPSVPLAGGDSIRVLTYQVVTNRETLGRAIDGRFGGATDRVDLAADAVKVDPATGDVTVIVLTESDASEETALRFPTPGLYPVAVQQLGADGNVVSQLVTFVDRLPPEGSDPPAAISIAVLASITAPPQLPGATTPLPADVTAALAELGRYPGGVPISLDISPDIVNRLDAATRENLVRAMANGVIMSQPLVPFDPSAATAAGLDDRFRDLLVAGETAIDSSGQLPTTNRTVWFAPNGITNAGARMLRDLNVRLLVIPSDVYLRAEGSNLGLTDYSQLFQSAIGTDDTAIAQPESADTASDDASSADDAEECTEASAGCLPTAAIDPLLSARLADAGLSDEQAALYTAADVVTYRDFFTQNMSANVPHALVLGLDGPGVANATRITRVAAMTTSVGAANFIPISDLEASSSQAVPDGRQLILRLPEPTPIDLTPRVKTLNLLSFAIPVMSSMLEVDGGRTKRWNDTVAALYSTSLTDEQVATVVAGIEAEMNTIKDCIIPPRPYTFTLTGRSTDLPLRLTNACGESLKVVVRLGAAAAKMDVPQDGTLLTLGPNASKSFPIPVTARTNGTFDVTLDVYAPQDSVTPITKRVTLTARVNMLTGLPQAITGVALLLLLTWWVRNLRRSRRARRSVAATAAHPAAGA